MRVKQEWEGTDPGIGPLPLTMYGVSPPSTETVDERVVGANALLLDHHGRAVDLRQSPFPAIAPPPSTS